MSEETGVRLILVGDRLWMVLPAVQQRMTRNTVSGAASFSEAVGSCHHASVLNDASHPHSVPLTAVQTVLVLDEEFVRAWYGPEAADRLFRKSAVEA